MGGPWGISTGGPGYSIGFWEMSRKPRSALDTLPDLKFYLKVEDYTSGNAWVDRVSNIEVHVPDSASFHEGYVHLSGTAITAPLQTNPNVMQSATYVIRLRVPTIPSNLGWVMSQFPDFGWSRALTISDYRLGHVGQTPGHFQSGLGSLPTDSWQVLVGTWTQGGACQTFLQGTSGNPRTCSNGAGTDSNEKLIIGGRGETDAGHNPDSIDISDVLVFNRILNTDEINFITSTLSEPKPCPALKCTIHCDTGYVTDANGCETCECQPSDAPTTSKPTFAPSEVPTTSNPTYVPSKSPIITPPGCTNNCVSTPGWTIDSNPVTTCGWMEHICGPMRRGECLEHGGNVKCQWGYVTGNHWANYGRYGSPVSHCCNCKGFQMPENYADGYWTTAPASWVWNGNWKNTYTSTGTELPICDPTNAPTETPTSSPVGD